MYSLGLCFSLCSCCAKFFPDSWRSSTFSFRISCRMLSQLVLLIHSFATNYSSSVSSISNNGKTRIANHSNCYPTALLGSAVSHSERQGEETGVLPFVFLQRPPAKPTSMHLSNTKQDEVLQISAAAVPGARQWSLSSARKQVVPSK